MKCAERVPEGYEVKTDMFGNPYLARIATPTQRRLANALAVPFAVLAVLIILKIASL